MHNNLSIKIVNPVLGDERAIVTVLKKSWLDTYLNKEYDITIEDLLSKDYDSDKKLNQWRETILTNGSGEKYICVAKDDDEVVGFCMAEKGERVDRIKTIYVLPPYKKLGIGSRMLTECMNWLGKNKNIYLEVASYNEGAINFYKKHGFCVLNESLYYKELPSGKKMPLIGMQLF